MKYAYDKVLEYIISQQDASGSFPTYKVKLKHYPDQKKKLIPADSPFITGNVAYCLISAQDEKMEPYIQRASDFLLSQMEYKGYWRFWRFRSLLHTFPLDSDDTGLCSHVLALRNITLNNKSVLAKNTDADGYFYTWLIPTAKNWMSSPWKTLQITAAFAKAFKRVSLTNRLQEHIKDKEPAIAANVVLYLGETAETARCIERIIDEIENDHYPLEYYQDEICAFYHISRAYKSGVERFGVLSGLICERIQQRFQVADENACNLDNTGDFLRIMAANVLLDFGYHRNLAIRMVDSLVHSERYPSDWEAEAYFVGKQRVFQAGSPVLTAALLLEAMVKINKDV